MQICGDLLLICSLLCLVVYKRLSEKFTQPISNAKRTFTCSANNRIFKRLFIVDEKDLVPER